MSHLSLSISLVGFADGSVGAAAVDRLLDRLPTVASDFGAGAALACVIALALVLASRALCLHWSWSALACAVVTLSWSALGSLAPVLAAATLAATLRGRRRQLNDRDAGADLAARAAARVTPARAVGLLIAGYTIGRRRAGAHGWFRRGELIIGRDRRGSLVTIPFGDADGGSHTLVLGATGSGKTVTQTWIATRAIERGTAAVVIDPKGDRDLREALGRAAVRAGRSFVEWSPDGPSVYNPFGRGGESEIADKLLAGERFSEPHYLRQAQRYVGHVVRALRGAGFEVSLRAVVHHLEPSALERLTRDLPREAADSTQRYLDSLAPRQVAELAGARDRLAIIAESDVGRWLEPSERAARAFDLLACVRARAIVYFDLAADSRPLLTQMLGAAIVQDLTTTVATLQRSPIPTVVVIDEFSTLAAEQVVRLFGRARSAGVSIVLGTQELADLRLAGRESLLEQVLGNVASLVAHRQVVPSSAQLIASLAGTAGAWRTSHHDGGRATRTRVREGVLLAEDVMSLAAGYAATIVPARVPRARIARILKSDRGEE
jgi:type IV secretory pathway TraG/TraD family ATPase VirD4